ncbi:MAG: hypothetical protein A3C71_01185 [Candidatus Yanofskybacteria bacterium RIFCSPHIGHO2_02_FULL_43_15c]|uniref:Uncharacterized protein n=2 Tax=Candidatus Yanofskyibacteriota TaxID=1752733 RepID=A0A1F8EEF2_9BACT|nr:MAG: hypothetical protein A2649_03835 [Candidatus Yanofskybacteria bacterium RIFCSPHIGHO2_01_FULL_41_26]OGN11575.1 MAG: hypothetical protein A3C71_01185 [Candidatus Yanofskybacteria bacterium RIFCSPHIGHO2_02_FULL_43_15c]OGN20956.1 MAG: hypothetical protein A2915_02755 [Candidatus Yanofskybacteria bacterium RIFCSPLOWO2_01_FULL_41_34]
MPIKIDCEAFQGKFIFRYEDGRKKLTPDELDSLQNHYKECGHCKAIAGEKGLDLSKYREAPKF